MTVRAVAIGTLLSLVISATTYFNDWVIGQTQLIGNHLPISVFGVAVLLLLCINPMVHRISARAPFRAGEIAIVIALGLSSSGWAGSNFFRGFATVTAYPAHWLKTKASWQSANVMSYVPGASKEIARGQVRTFIPIAQALVSNQEPPSAGQRVVRLLPDLAQRSLRDGLARGFDVARSAELTDALNALLTHRELFQRSDAQKIALAPRAKELAQRDIARLSRDELVELNRWYLTAVFPAALSPPPPGAGLLFDGGRADPFALDTLVQGRGAGKTLALTQLPWKRWQNTIELWWGTGLFLAFAALCLALVVHPQWSKRELLPYPIARFVEECSARQERARLPDIARNRLFWIGVFGMLGLHLINGLHAWIPDVPELPRKFDFWSLSQIFPNAVRASGSYGYFAPTFYGSVIAFSFFLSSSVSFSLGVAELLYMVFAGTLLGYGIQVEGNFLEGTGSNMMRFGSFLAVFAMILFTGRRYFGQVLASMVGRRSDEVPRYATWAARGAVLSLVLTVVLLRSSGIGLFFATAFVGLEIVIFVVMSRMIAETGTFFMQHAWAPVGILTGLFGFGAIGPSTYIALAVATSILSIDSRELLMPFIVNGIKIVDRADGPTPAKVAPLMAFLLPVTLVVAGATTLYLQYNHGATPVGNNFATDWLPTLAFDSLAQRIATATADGTLVEATTTEGLRSFALVRPEAGSIPWLSLGLAIGFGAAIARLRWPFWPLHPVAFLVWSTYPIAMFGPSFLLGWMIKSAVVGTAGAKGYHQTKPLMVGVIAGELISGLFWMIFGAGYYFTTGKAPVAYSIFPM
jgi:hypothetical protein